MSEKLYDEIIAPELKRLSEICQANGMPFVALVEYEPGQEGRTEYLPDTASLPMVIATMAARCDANVDALCISISRYCERKGIDTKASAYLNWMKRT